MISPDYKNRNERLSNALSSKTSGIFITVQPTDIEYLTGLSSSPGCLLVIPEGKPILFMDGSRWNGAVAQNPYANLYRMQPGKNLSAVVSEFCSTREIELICEDLPMSFVEGLTRAKQLSIQRSQEVLSGFRRSKDTYEQNKLRLAAHLGDRCMEVARQTIRPGLTELQVAGEVDRFVKAEGGEGTWFLHR